MATINQSYNGFAAHAREATEKSVEAFTLATKPFTPSATAQTDVPAVLAEPVQRYFHLFRRAVVANLELATKWTELVVAFSGANGVLGAEAGKAGEAVQDSADAVTEVLQDSADAVTEVLQDSAEAVVDVAADVAERTESTGTDEVDEAAERAEAKHAHELAREPYLSLTKAELSALLAERGLPKTGTINTLVERLVSADAK